MVIIFASFLLLQLKIQINGQVQPAPPATPMALKGGWRLEVRCSPPQSHLSFILTEESPLRSRQFHQSPSPSPEYTGRRIFKPPAQLDVFMAGAGDGVMMNLV